MVSLLHLHLCSFKENAQFVQKVAFECQTKPFWKLEILQKLLLLKAFFI